MSSKKQYPSLAQKTLLCELLERDDDLRKGKFSAAFTKKHLERRWMDIAENINSLGGVNKTWTQWRKTWQDMKTKTKKKQAAINRFQNSTGGGPPVPTLSEHDTIILNTINEVAISGHADSEESMVYSIDPIPIRYSQPEVETLLETTSTCVASDRHSIQTNNEDPKNNFKAPKRKHTKAQMRLEKSLDTAASLIDILKEKNDIKKTYYQNKIIEMQTQTAAMQQLSASLKQIESLLLLKK